MSPASAWEPKPQQNAKALRLFRDGMENMHDALWSFRENVWRLPTATRNMSVELRKFLFDGTPLVHRVLHRPRFHPLKRTESLIGDVYFKERTLSMAPGTERGPIPGLAASHTWTIAVHPLHGLRYEEHEERWYVEPAFDVDAEPMALGTWLNQGLYRVDGREYSLLDTLKFVSNKEAVHADIEKDTMVRDMERVHFGHITYPHLVVLNVVSYLLEQYRSGVRDHEARWRSFTQMPGHEPAEFKVSGGIEFRAEIDPMGFQGEFHETGIQLPMPGRPWKAVQIREEAVVRPRVRGCRGWPEEARAM